MICIQQITLLINFFTIFRCGLQPGDIIAEINGRDVDGMRCVYEALETESILRLKIFRQNTFFYVNVPVEQL